LSDKNGVKHIGKSLYFLPMCLDGRQQ
jgi:hypothetical protein